MGAGGYGAAGLSVRAGMGISELAGARGKRAERSRAKGRAAAKGLHEKIPTEGAEIIPRYQNKAPWPRGGCSASPGARRGRQVPFSQPIRSAREAGSRLAPLPLTWKSFARVYVPEFAWHVAPSRLSKVGCDWPSAEVPGEAPSPRRGRPGWSPWCESGTRDQIPHPLPLTPPTGNSMALGSRCCPQFSPIPRSTA